MTWFRTLSLTGNGRIEEEIPGKPKEAKAEFKTFLMKLPKDHYHIYVSGRYIGQVLSIDFEKTQ